MLGRYYHDGTGWVDLTAAPPPTPPDVQDFTSSGTWLKPVGARLIFLEIVSAGGGGYGVAGTAGAGGGGGGYYSQQIDADDLSASEPVTVGAGGTGGVPSTDGGYSEFAGIKVLGGRKGQGTPGGAGGALDGANAPAANQSTIFGGGGGGISGVAGTRGGGSSSFGAGGGGAAGSGAAGTGGQLSASFGRLAGGNGGAGGGGTPGSGTAPGGGGGGRDTSAGGGTGGDGAPGQIRITTYF